jgi:hypothetical protein
MDNVGDRDMRNRLSGITAKEEAAAVSGTVMTMQKGGARLVCGCSTGTLRGNIS